MSKTIKNLLLYATFFAAVYAVVYYGGLYYYKVQADQAAPPQAYLHHYVYKEPYIDGPPEFQQDIENALATIKEVSPEQYEDVCKYCVQVKLIESDSSYAATINRTGTIRVFNWYYDLTNGKGSLYNMERMLVHESAHAIQYAQGRGTESKMQLESEALVAERQLLTALMISTDIIEQVAGDHLLETRWWEESGSIIAKDNCLESAMGRN